MRNCTVGLVLVGLVACQAPAKDTGRETQAVIGGDNFVTGLESVCSILVTRPPDDEGEPVEPPTLFCSCTKIAPSIVLTAASCVEPNVTAETLTNLDIRFGTSFDGGIKYAATEVVLQRYYDPDSPSVNDLAMIRLDSDPPEAAAVLSETVITSDHVGPATIEECLNGGVADLGNLPAGCAAIVGFGETADPADDHGAKKKIVVPMRSADRRTLAAGTVEVTTCDGDSGGPMFMDLGDGLELVAVTAVQRDCSSSVVRTRIQPHLANFIFPYIDRFGATCGLDGSTCEDTGCPRTPDPDCDDCSWNGVCEQDCPTRDWDCELGINPGLACTQSGECEFGGRCIEAADDASFTYCSQPCVPADDFCAGGMVCGVDTDGEGTNECTWPLPSPGSQGAACTDNLQCRSGICEELICVNECEIGAADGCPTNHVDPEQPYTCGASGVAAGKNVCLGTVFSGGGGFCSVDAADPASPVRGPHGRGLLVLLGLVGFALVFRSRRA